MIAMQVSTNQSGERNAHIALQKTLRKSVNNQRRNIMENILLPWIKPGMVLLFFILWGGFLWLAYGRKRKS